MTGDEEDLSTWPRNKQVIRRDELLRLIEENEGPEGLDLRGAVFLGEPDRPEFNPVNLRPGALAPLAEAYRQASGGSDPPWLSDGGGIDLRGAQLRKAYLSSAQLQGARLEQANLGEAQLQGAHLQKAQLQGAILWNAQLQGANLEDAELQGASLISAQLQGANLARAQLQGAHLNWARVEGAFLANAQLQGAFLTDVDLRRATLKDANLKKADLSRSQLQDLDLYHVESLEGAHWYGALLDHTRLKREDLGKAIGDELTAHEEKTQVRYDRAKETYLLLKNNFNQIGRYEDASWAYVKEQQMERMAYYREAREHGWRIWRAWSPFWRCARNWAYELSTGYGERPWNAVGLGAFIMAAFAVGFWLTGAVSAGRPRWFTSWNPGDIDWAGLGDALTYSLATFATFNLGRTALNPEGRGVEIASSIEALLGIAILALVVFTLGNRMSRG